MKKTLSLIFALLIALSLIGCADSTPSASIGNTGGSTTLQPTATVDAGITVTDLSGIEVTLKKTPEKVVSLVPSVTEMLFAMDAGSLICGRDGSSNYPAEAADITVMGDYAGPNLELIVAAQPDVVFTAGKLQAEAEQQLRDAGIAVINAEAGNLEQVKQSIELLGAVCARKDKAEALCAQIDTSLSDIKALAGDKLSAYYIVSTGEYGEWSVGPGSFIFDTLTLGGLELITKDMEYAYPQFSLEAIAAANPYVIIADSNTTLEYLRGAEMFKDLDAVKNGRVVIVDADKASRPTVRFFQEMLRCIKQIKEAD